MRKILVLILSVTVALCAVSLFGCNCNGCGHTHDYSWKTTKQATCTEDGSKTGTCACGDVVEEVIPASHKFENDICTVCGARRESKGLELISYDNGTCYVKSIGTCTDTDICIPTTSPEGDMVVSIGWQAFINNEKITRINIPDTVTYLGVAAFNGCKNLATVVMPSALESISSDAFNNCDSLTRVSIPSNTVEIAENAFHSCNKLENIIVAEDNPNYKSIDGNLYNKDGTVLLQYAIGKPDTEFTIPSGVTTIKADAFMTNNSLTTVNIPDNVNTIERGAFEFCYKLETVNIAAGVTDIASSAFYSCNKLENINVDEDNPNYKTIDGSFYSKDGKTLIRYAIGKTAESVVILSGVETIGRQAFEGSMNMTSVTIPVSVKVMESEPFFYCKKLAAINYDGTKEDWAKIEKNGIGYGVLATFVTCTDGTVNI